MTTTPHALRISNLVQTWAGTAGQLTTDNWGVPSIVGYRGDGMTSNTSTDPQTVLADGDGTPVNLINGSTSGSATGGVHEISDDVVALQGSGTADAPHLVIYLDTTDVQDVRFTATLRELDSSTTDQKFAVQYRVGGTGNFVNLPAGAVSNVFNSAGNQTVALDVTLPDAADNQALVEIRIITNDAPGNDAMVGIDNINVTSVPLDTTNPGTLTLGSDVSVVEGNDGFRDVDFTVNRTGGTSGAVTASYQVGFGTATASDFEAGMPTTGSVTFADGQASAVIRVRVAGDTQVEGNETFTVTLTDGGEADLGADVQATGTIVNDDSQPGMLAIGNVSLAEGDAGTTALTFTVTRTGGSDGAVSAHLYDLGFTGANAGRSRARHPADRHRQLRRRRRPARPSPFRSPATPCSSPTRPSPSPCRAPTGGADQLGRRDRHRHDSPTTTPRRRSTGACSSTRSIMTIRASDAGEPIEVAGPAGTNLAGWTLVLYNGNGGHQLHAH